MNKTQIFVNVFTLIATPIAFVYFTRRAKLKEKGEWELNRRKKIHNRYVLYYNNVLLRSRFRRIVQRYATLDCYDIEETKEKSVKLFEKAMISAALFIFGVLIGFGDVLLAVLAALIAYIYYNMTVEGKLDSSYKNIITELSTCVQSIGENYKSSHDVASAVLNSEKGRYLTKQMDEIYDMLISVDSEDKLDRIRRRSPIHVLKTLAVVCFITKQRGDTKNEQTGGYAFVDEMIILRQEIDCEIRKIKKIEIAFKSLTKLALAGLIAAPIIDRFLLKQIPATTAVIKGMYGSIEKAVLIMVVAISYYVISIFNRPSVINSVDKVPWIDRMSKQQKVRRKLQNFIPKKTKTLHKLKALMSDAISSKDLEYLYLAKIVYSLFAGIGTFIIIVGFTISAKSFVWNSHANFGFVNVKVELTERATERLYEVEKYYMLQTPKMLDEDAREYLKARMPDLKTMELDSQLSRFSKKYDLYRSIGFKWWYVLIALIAGVCGWFAPHVGLTLRKKLVEFEESEDVMQLQTLMMTLSQTTMSVYEVLYWLEKQSTLHKAPLAYALQSYMADPDMALEVLKSTVRSRDFKRLIAKLQISVKTLSLREAFSDIALDKEQLLRLREMAQDEAIESKKQYARLIAQLPIFIVLIGNFLAPVLIEGFKEVGKLSGTL